MKEKLDKSKPTKFGILMRHIRINSGDTMQTMSEKLGISLSYLSAIENGRRNIPNDIMAKLSTHYDLTDIDKEKLNAAIAGSSDTVRINLTSQSEKMREVIYKLSTDEYDDSTLDRLYNIVFKKEEE